MTIEPGILIVEDDLIVAQDIQIKLEKNGYHVIGIHSRGEDALAICEKNPPELVLMDIVLEGDIDGIDTAYQINAIADVPIVYLTAYADEDSLERAKVSKAYGYLIKPFDERTLISTIRLALYKHKMDVALRQREEWFRGIVEQNADAVVSIDLAGKITYVSPAMMNISGYSPDEILGRSLSSLLSEPDLKRIDHIFNKTLLSKALPGELGKGNELKLVSKNADDVNIELYGIPVLKEGVFSGIHCILRDITERKKFELELQHMATHDYLTDLPNTRLFLAHLEKAMARARRSQQCVALLYLDLDGFKTVNDTWGHSIGDTLLCMVARRLEESVRKGDVVSRLGGDEFAILMTDLQYKGNVEPFIDRLHQAMQDPFYVNNIEARITVSIGISMFPMDAMDADSLISYADRAMFYSKSIGKNRYFHYCNIVKIDI